jgi:hypothetical protein
MVAHAGLCCLKVTGVTGFIASHITDQLLADGYTVRGTARSAAKSEYLQKVFDDKYGAGKFEIVMVLDLEDEGAFDQSVHGEHSVVVRRAGLSVTSVTRVVLSWLVVFSFLLSGAWFSFGTVQIWTTFFMWRLRCIGTVAIRSKSTSTLRYVLIVASSLFDTN